MNCLPLEREQKLTDDVESNVLSRKIRAPILYEAMKVYIGTAH